MPVRVHVSDIFESPADGLILSIDGQQSGMQGQVARAFEKRWPNQWQHIENNLQLPIPLGHVEPIELDDVGSCPFGTVFFASTLHHLGVLTPRQKQRLVAKATTNALKAAARLQIECLASTVMVGGWRLSLDQALVGMLSGFKAALPQARTIELNVYGLDPELKAIARRLGLP